jgi:hypothetical protein
MKTFIQEISLILKIVRGQQTREFTTGLWTIFFQIDPIFKTVMGCKS